MRVAVIGATGVAGRILLPPVAAARPAAPRAAAVRSVQRRAGAVALTTASTPRVCDILDPASLAPLLAGCDAVINLATSIPKAGGSGDWAANDRVRAAGTQSSASRVHRGGRAAPGAAKRRHAALRGRQPPANRGRSARGLWGAGFRRRTGAERRRRGARLAHRARWPFLRHGQRPRTGLGGRGRERGFPAYPATARPGFRWCTCGISRVRWRWSSSTRERTKTISPATTRR